MPNSLSSTGMTIASYTEVVNAILNGSDGYQGLLQIYGPNLNVDPNTPDGNMVNIYAQASEDNLELLLQGFTSMDPDEAVGTVLDSRVTWNGIQRLGATYTLVVITVTANIGTVMPGLDLYPNGGAFTIADEAGNQYANTLTITVASSPVNLVFQAVDAGPVNPGTSGVFTIVTPTLGVTAVAQDGAPEQYGTYEESDSALRIRRQQQVTSPGRSWYQAIYANLMAVTGVTSVNIVENTTNGTVGGVPANSIWIIVAAINESSATLQNAIATAIYNQATAGCGMIGGVVVNVTQPTGAIYQAKWDWTTAENLYFRASLTAITGTIDEANIAAQILTQFGNSYQIGQSADTASIVAFIKSIAPNASVSNEGLSTDDATWVPLVTPAAVNNQLTIPNIGHITLT